MIVVGVSLFSVLTSFIATSFVARRQNEEREVDLSTLRDDLLAAISAREAIVERESAALRAELAEMRRLLISPATAAARGGEELAARNPAEEVGQPL
jgi:hypothetical protein